MDSGGPGLNDDVLGGVRYNKMEFGVDATAAAAGLVTSRSRNRSENWWDGVVGVRGEYDYGDGWAATGWADVGAGSGSRSYQLRADVSYRFDNNVKLYGGYRYYHFEYDSGSGANAFGINADYSGPTMGISYQF